ncbi:arsenic resistance protein [Gulosibacter molinativorax]|uniref:arsenic resistance protein n=1 Tax=Gulosibacter molinativorax TaxID=256821 RepID=UPI0011B1DC2F|nr:hypothetical protein [Gulosibacter molinativorax]
MLRRVVGVLSAPRPALVTGLFLVAIAVGTLTGWASPAAGEALGDLVDPLILVLVGAIFFTLRFDGWRALRSAPRTVAVVLRLLLRSLPQELRSRVLDAVDAAVPYLIAALIVYLFAANSRAIWSHPGDFGWVLLAVFVFFVATYALGEAVARLFRLEHGAHALLTMTTSARNAPLMLALTTAAFPEQPLVAAAIVLGMLIEFPHLTVLTQVFRRRDRAATSEKPAPVLLKT